ncbi:type III pantothenate kinase [Nitrosomonas sp.]|uniref:type III pantothenate kinase n=1 Tax=Nitrosomonas sp. TaxID=42353 RepID=UPI0025E15C96|nr:type III pantothenate kinase [Nitrosomonas sp.]MBY0483397.1 type III pantothenate kinase [Nitrosomonas sp.]
MSYILAIDSGNSFIKWGLFNHGCCLKLGKIQYDKIQDVKNDFKVLQAPESIIISHVSREATKNQICEQISRWPVKPHWIRSCAFQCGVTNSYSNPAQLGCDRWASLIAAWEMQQQACLVINIGTAVTIDALSESGEFLGGIILPGFHLMLNSLQRGTQLFNAGMSTYEDFPINTNSAIQSGIIHSVIGAIERMYNLLSLKINHPVKTSIVSGGGVSLLSPFITIPIKTIDNLVLKGLVLIAEDSF